MHIFKEIEPLRAFLNTRKLAQQWVGLVPTMGALHAGHLALISASKKENPITVCSIFVNPTQFNNPGDLEKYPRTLETDIALLEKAGCDVLFCPSNSEMYKVQATLKFDFGTLDKILEGEFRPGHFSGVALVVSKLFNIVKPDYAYFGQKDFQQVSIVAKLIEELSFGIKLRVVPTLREADGLAMSSRNVRLDPTQRQTALVFYRVLSEAKAGINSGKKLTEVKNLVTERFKAVNGARLEYFEIVDRQNLNTLESVNVPGQAVMLIAGFVGEVRLIDNMLV